MQKKFVCFELADRLHHKVPFNVGIYALRNRANGKIYVGSSVEVPARLAQHRFALLHKKHKRKELQGDFNKYGIEKFEVVFLEKVTGSLIDLGRAEQKWLDHFKATDPRHGYCRAIRTLPRSSRFGLVVTEESRAKQRKAARKRWSDPKERKKASARRRKFYRDHPEAAEAHSRRMKGRTSPRKGAKLTKKQVEALRQRVVRHYRDHPEIKRKIARSLSKTLQKTGAWNRGKKISKRKYPKWGNTGHKHSAASIAKMKRALKGRVAWNKGLKSSRSKK